MLPLKFLLGSLNSLSLETEMLELFDWDETNFAKYNMRVFEAFEAFEDTKTSFYNGEAFVDHLVSLSNDLLAEDNRAQLKNTLSKLVENTFNELVEQSETPELEN